MTQFANHEPGHVVDSSDHYERISPELAAIDAAIAEHPADCDGSVTVPDAGFGGQDMTHECEHLSHRPGASRADVRVYRAEIIAPPAHFQVLRRATIEFVAADQEQAEQQAEVYARRFSAYDVAEVDSVHEIGERP